MGTCWFTLAPEGRGVVNLLSWDNHSPRGRHQVGEGEEIGVTNFERIVKEAEDPAGMMRGGVADVVTRVSPVATRKHLGKRVTESGGVAIALVAERHKVGESLMTFDYACFKISGLWECTWD